MRRGFAWVVFWGLCLLVPRVASAWTNAQVRDVRAHVVVDEEGHARVTLDLGIEVLGGWLTRFDLDGLGENLTLDEQRPAWVITDEGVTVLPKASAELESVTLRFEKHDGIRKGLHRLGVAYRTELMRSEGESGELWSFALPGFQQSIRPAELTFETPPAFLVVTDPENAAEQTSRLVEGRRVTTLSRSLWPRATSWTTSFEKRLDLSPAGRKATGIPQTQRKTSTGFALAACVLALGLAARASFRRAARSVSMTASPWFVDHSRRSLLLVGSALLAAGTWSFSLEFSLGCLLLVSALCFDRLRPAHTPVRLARVRFLQRGDFTRSRRARFFAMLGKTPWADASSAIGALSFVLIAALPFVRPAFAELNGDPWVLGLWCALPSFIQSSRLRLPRNAHERLSMLVRAARGVRAVGCAFRFVSYMDPQGTLIEPRLRVTPAARYSGLLRIDVCADSRRETSELELIVVVRGGSQVDVWLTSLWGAQARVISARGHRTAFVTRVPALSAALEELLTHMDAQSAHALSAIEGTARAA